MSKNDAKSAGIISKKWRVYGRASGRSPEIHVLTLFTTMEVALSQLADEHKAMKKDFELQIQKHPTGTWAIQLLEKINTLENYFTYHSSMNFYEVDLDSGKVPVKIEREDIKEMIRKFEQ